MKSQIGVAIIHLAQLLPAGSSDLPGGRSSFTASGGQPFLTPPYLVLHCEEFAWPRMSPRAPVRSYFKPSRAAPFHPSPAAAFRRPPPKRCPTGAGNRLVCSLLHLSSLQNFRFEIKPEIVLELPAVSGLAAL